MLILHGLGPIVRIGPDELHIRDPEAYDQVYRVGDGAGKWSWYYSCFGVGKSCFGTLDYAEHNKRRAAINGFFSRQSVIGMEDTFARPIEKVCALLGAAKSKGPGSTVSMEFAYRSIGLDAVSEIAFGRSFDFLDMQDSGKTLHEGMEDSLRTICVIRHFPFLVPVFNNVPLWLMRMAGEKMSAIRMMKEFAQAAAKSALTNGSSSSNGSSQHSATPPQSRTIIKAIIENPDPQKTGVITRQRLEEESLSLIAASADTTGNAMTMATYQLLQHPAALKRLQGELREAMPAADAGAWKALPYEDLANLPYLVCGYLHFLTKDDLSQRNGTDHKTNKTAVIKEALRMSYGLMGRLPRVVPASGMRVLDCYIPAGVSKTHNPSHMHAPAWSS